MFEELLDVIVWEKDKTPTFFPCPVHKFIPCLDSRWEWLREVNGAGEVSLQGRASALQGQVWSWLLPVLSGHPFPGDAAIPLNACS